MKVIVIGATGTIGAAIVARLESDHEVICASRSGPVHVDMDVPGSVDALFDGVRDVDAVVCASASGRLARLESDDYRLGIEGKLFGQVHLVRVGAKRLRDGGSITLTSGVFDRPEPGMAFGALVNAGLEAFVGAAALEMPRGIRLNVVSPGWVAETLRSMGRDEAGGTPVCDVAAAYVAGVQGSSNGKTLRPSNGIEAISIAAWHPGRPSTDMHPRSVEGCPQPVEGQDV